MRISINTPLQIKRVLAVKNDASEPFKVTRAEISQLHEVMGALLM